jgi:cell division FtsZ-interacting protein ZapD
MSSVNERISGIGNNLRLAWHFWQRPGQQLQQSNLIATVKGKVSVPGGRSTFGKPKLEVLWGNSSVSAKFYFPDKDKDLI